MFDNVVQCGVRRPIPLNPRNRPQDVALFYDIMQPNSREANNHMNKQELVDASKDHLRLSIACTLNIRLDDFRGSIDTQTAVNRCLTNVMSLGYNDSLAEALKELLEYRFFGGSPSSEEFDELVTELRATRNTFAREVSAYSYLHRKFKEGEVPSIILHHVKSITPLTDEYKKAEQN